MNMNVPKHIAIIMDGNGRWAKEKKLPRIAGHREGIERVRETVKSAAELGVKVVTFFAFSTENWARPKKEIDGLLKFLDYFLEREVKELDKNNVRLKFIGREKPIPENLLKKMRQGEEKTKDNTGLVMVLALNYGSRQEIVDAAKKFASLVKSGKKEVEDLDVDLFGSYLYTQALPDPDLLIRTSGEMRLSNYLLWQLSYAELYFPKKYWPDFKRSDLEEAIKEFQKRERRFGGINVEE
ncbi:MAG: isoprenyl transferase [Candidatus Omnitrophica bacterium]|nr:isoprenyl transferase [Candidatus Omnitrophota bacterium]